MEILPTSCQVRKRDIKQIIEQVTTISLSSPTLCKVLQGYASNITAGTSKVLPEHWGRGVGREQRGLDWVWSLGKASPKGMTFKLRPEAISQAYEGS